MKNIKKQWFTLVELVVVITILAILWSIAFISLQGYTSDARNSKRTSDLGSLQSALSTQLAQWQAILSFVTSVSDNRIVTWSATAIWWTWIIYGTDYDAGTINYAALPVKQVDFQDPTEQDYAFWATTKKNWQYELAATIEQWQWAKIAKVQWTYGPRKKYTVGITWTTNPVITNLTWSLHVNYFYTWDWVVRSGGTAVTWSITKISADWMAITTSTWYTTNTSITLAAENDEPRGLIRWTKWTEAGTIIYDQWNALPY